MDASAASSPLRLLFAKQDDPYADADREAARRWAGLLFVLQSALIAGLSPLAPPDDRFGAIGWAALAGIVLAQLGVAWILLRHGDRVGDNVLLAFSYFAITVLGVLEWLAGGHDSACLPIFLLWIVFVPASHPPRRVLAFAGFAVLAVAAPLAYEGWNRTEAAELTSNVAVWIALVIVIMFRVQAFRQERIGLSRSGEEAIKMAVTDPLTGLANRRAFGEVAEREVARAEAAGSPLTLVIADVDGFKALNDLHGHVNGDQYLRRISATLTSMLREDDLGFRWGGDEFAILLRGTDRATAEGVCARIGGVVSATLEETVGVDISLSFGLAEHSPGISADELVLSADKDLMAAKVGDG